jgi:spore germination protein KB
MGQPLKISAQQASALLVTLILSTGVLAAPSFAIISSGRGAWLSMLIAALVAVPLILAYSKLATFAPTLFLTERLILLVGPLLGRPLSLGFSLFFLFSSSAVICIGGTLIQIIFLQETPLEVIIAGLALISLYGAWLGPQTLARLNTLYLPFLSLTFLALFVGTLSNPHWIYLWPPLDLGLPAVIAGSIPTIAWICELSLILFMSPDISNFDTKSWRVLLSAGLISGGFFILITILALVAFGPVLAMYYNFPVLQLGRKFGTNIRGFDALILTVWVVGAFQKTALWLHYPIKEIGYIFRLQNHKALLPPMIILVSIIALGAPFNIIEWQTFNKTIWPSLALGTFEGVIPCGLILAWLRYSQRTKAGR